ncbi:MAG TPA: metallophosphoesterase, partial [Desulfosporosinus sp.]|nr:metallophosphoesterase [Desulfosporosinus sp.]
RFSGAKRQDLETLMQGVNRSLPVLLMDHQPSQLAEPVEQGVDLQVSGHTHRGQMFPIQFITSRIFENDWGYLRKGDFQLIVSSGYGTWGPPVRIGNTPEIVDITIRFSE